MTHHSRAEIGTELRDANVQDIVWRFADATSAGDTNRAKKHPKPREHV